MAVFLEIVKQYFLHTREGAALPLDADVELMLKILFPCERQYVGYIVLPRLPCIMEKLPKAKN